MNEHFLIIGFSGSINHINYALKNNITINLLIEKNKYRKEYQKIFTNIKVIDDIFDFNQIKLAIKDLSITRVFTRFEKYIVVVGAINEYLGLKGIHYQTAMSFGNKYLMKKKWLSAKIPCANGVCANDKIAVKNFLKQHKFPLILKKASSTHSSFVCKIKSERDLNEKIKLFSETTNHNKGNKPVINFKTTNQKHCSLVLEEMLDGIEITVDTFVSKDVFTHTPICRYVLPQELGINDSYLPIRSTPISLGNKEKKQIFSTVQKAIKTLGANNCVCHTELFYNKKKNKCFVIESTPRGGGNRSIMINTTTNQDYDQAIFLATSGKKIKKFELNGKSIAVVEYFAEKTGVIEKMDLSFMNQFENVKILRVRFKKGDKVKQAWTGGLSIVTFAVTGQSNSNIQEFAIDLFNKTRKMIVVK